MKINSFSSAFLSEIQIYAIIHLTTIQGRNINNFDILLGESEPFTTFISCKVANLHPFLGMFWNFYSWNFSKHLQITASRYYITLHSNFSFWCNRKQCHIQHHNLIDLLQKQSDICALRKSCFEIFWKLTEALPQWNTF